MVAILLFKIVIPCRIKNQTYGGLSRAEPLRPREKREYQK